MEGCEGMFEVGERVVYGQHGVCRIVKIDGLDLPDVPKERQYYYLEPTLDGSGIVYAPVDNPKIAIRSIMSKDEIMTLIGEMDGLDTLTVENDRLRETEYKSCIRSLDGRQLVRLLKTVHQRAQERIAKGKKITALDERYMKLAEMQLYSEIAEVLDIPRGEVEHFIQDNLAVS